MDEPFDESEREFQALKELLASSPDEDTFLERVVEACAAAVGGVASVWIHDAAADRLVLRACSGYPRSLEEIRQVGGGDPPSYEVSGTEPLGVTVRIFTSRGPVSTGSLSQLVVQPGWRGLFDELLWAGPSQCQAFYGTPLPSAESDKGAPLGVLKVEHRSPDALRRQDKNLIEVVAALIGFGLDSSPFDALEGALSALWDYANTYPKIAEICASATKAEACSIFLQKPESGRLVMHGDFGHDHSFVGREELEYTYGREDGGITWDVFDPSTEQGRVGYFLARTEDEVKSSGQWRSRLWAKQWQKPGKVCSSLYVRAIRTRGGGPIGIIKVENKKTGRPDATESAATGEPADSEMITFSERDRKIIDMLSEAIGAKVARERRTGKADSASNYSDIFGVVVLQKIRDLASIDDFDKPHQECQRICDALMTNSDVLQPQQLIASKLRELLAVSGYPGDLARLYGRLSTYEVVLRQERGYRDHTIHAFNVFTMGYAILRQLPEDVFAKASATLRERHGPSADPLRAWMLCSLFHDIGLPAQHVEKWLAAFFRDLYGMQDGGAGDPAEHVRSTVSVHFLHHAEYAAHFSRLVTSLAECLDIDKHEEPWLHDLVMDKLERERNHGVISALILAQAVHALGGDASDPTVKAALAGIALHDKGVWEAITKARKGVPPRPITFGRSPIAFLIGYCDNSQEWGRAKSRFNEVELALEIDWSGLPKLTELVVDRSTRHVRSTLRYEHPADELLEKLPKIHEGLTKGFASGSSMTWVIACQAPGKHLGSATFPCD